MIRFKRAGRFAVLLSLAALAACQTTKQRITGPVAPRGVYTWQAEIFMKGTPLLLEGEQHNQNGVDFDKHECGASVIAPEWVLTAAHCVTLDGTSADQFAQTFQVAVGIFSLSDRDLAPGADRYPTLIYDMDPPIAHPQWRGVKGDFDHDVALIHLKRPIAPTAAAHAIPLANQIMAPGLFNVTGWGRDTAWPKHRGKWNGHYGLGDQSMELRVAQMRYLKPSACTPAHDGQPFPNASHLCAGAANDKPDTPGGTVQSDCFGDSGGPLVQKLPGDRYVQVGVVSYGRKGTLRCGDPVSPGDAFTDLTKPDTIGFICGALPGDLALGGYCDTFRAKRAAPGG